MLRWIIFRDSDPSYPNPLPLAIPLIFDFDMHTAQEPYDILTEVGFFKKIFSDWNHSVIHIFRYYSSCD